MPTCPKPIRSLKGAGHVLRFEKPQISAEIMRYYAKLPSKKIPMVFAKIHGPITEPEKILGYPFVLYYCLVFFVHVRNELSIKCNSAKRYWKNAPVHRGSNHSVYAYPLRKKNRQQRIVRKGDESNNKTKTCAILRNYQIKKSWAELVNAWIINIQVWKLCHPGCNVWTVIQIIDFPDINLAPMNRK